ncbi:glycosyltransferase [Brachybacterium saurashtrense]|uniref:Glycosyltransferase n=1 Tax=Brachybacterium saurashtrense TaxID=556288 RepID=A0AA93AS12_9MICO|nr:glycosyltransferase [Brachybacterium saurashtrense]RRR21084.1 glycosyltransferase [Brachybacterium saurashtrense]
MRVTAVTTWFPTQAAPSRGAFVVRDLQAIAAHAEVRLVHLVPPADDDGTRRLVHEGLEVLRIPMDPRRPDQVLRASRALARAMRGADLVHSMAFSSLLPLALRRPDVPWLHTEHWSALTTPSTLPLAARTALPALSRMLALPDRVTAVCEFLARPIRAVRGGRETAVVPCIVEPGPLVARRDRADGRLQLVSTGGLIERKDPLLAVEVLARLVEDGADAHLEWLGEGPLRAATEARARELGVKGRLALPGTRSPAEVREALGRADLFFGPTRADNFFVSAAEAIVAGRPVVLGATGGQGEYVRPEVGALVPVQDAAAYAEAVLAVDARTRDLSAEVIAGTIGDAFSTATVGRAYAAQYRELLAGVTARRAPAAGSSSAAVRDAAASLPAAPATPSGGRRVEVIIACHTPERPVGRAVASVLDGNGEDASVAVICHNRSAEEIAAALRPQDVPRVRFLEHRDEHRSASGPFNAGIASSEAEFVAIIGSDDTLEPGAVASWLAVQARTGAEFVLTRLALGGPGHGVPTPAVRMHRAGLVDLVADRLSYRSAPLGLMRREMLRRTGLALVEGATVGGDVAMVTQMMASVPTAYDRCGPAYVIGEDAGDRVTYVVRPMTEQLGFVPPLLEAEWFTALPRRARAAIGTKILRIHVFGAVFYRGDEEIWTAAEREDLARLTAQVLEAAPGAQHPLSRADRRLLDACLDPSVPAPRLIAAAQQRRRHGRPGTLLPRDLAWTLHREAPLRFMAASLAVRHLPRASRR